MRVSFEATIDEIVDAHLRLFAESAVGRRDRGVASVATAALTGAAVFYILRGSLLLAIPLTGVGAALGYLLFGREYRKTLRKKTRKLVIEQLGRDAPVPVSVSLDPEVLIVEQLATTVHFRWEQVTRMVDLPAAVEFRAVQPAALMRVLARAFASMADRAAFVRLARDYLRAAGQPVEPEPAGHR